MERKKLKNDKKREKGAKEIKKEKENMRDSS